MKISALSIFKIIIPVLVVIVSQTRLFSQENDSIRSKGLFVGLSLEPSRSQIINTGSSSVTGIASDKANTFGASAEVGYFFSRYIGVSSGIGFNTFKAPVMLDTYQNQFNTVDSEGDAYEMRVTGTGMMEDQKISYLTVPLYLNIRLPITGTIGFFVQTGLDMSFAVNNSYSSNGTFTYKGYYPKYNVLLYNLPAFGFATDKNTTTTGTMDIKPFTLFAAASAGFDFFVMQDMQLAIGATYNKSLSKVSAYPTTDNFQLTESADHINSFMGGGSSVVAQSIGLSLKLRYYF